MENGKTFKVFSGRASTKLTKMICRYLNAPMGKAELTKFSDGEIRVKLAENIRGIDTFIVQSTHPPAENLMELLIMIDAAKRASASRITAVIPYYGYARQDRKDEPRVAITAKLIADLITVSGADRVLTMDLHAAQIQGFFNIPLDHLYGSAVFLDYFKQKKYENLIVVAPDIGSSKIARAYAKRLDAGLAIIDKRRPEPNEAEVMNLIGDVKGKNVLMIDDMVDTAGTLVRASNALKEFGAEKIFAASTHPVLSDNAIQKIEDSPISKVTVTDTVPLKTKSAKFEILSSDKLFGEAIRRIHNEESISVLFSN